MQSVCAVRGRMRWLLAAVLVAGSLVAGGAACLAQTPDLAKRLYEEGAAAYEAGRLDEAMGKLL